MVRNQYLSWNFHYLSHIIKVLIVLIHKGLKHLLKALFMWQIAPHVLLYYTSSKKTLLPSYFGPHLEKSNESVIVLYLHSCSQSELCDHFVPNHCFVSSPASLYKSGCRLFRHFQQLSRHNVFNLRSVVLQAKQLVLVPFAYFKTLFFIEPFVNLYLLLEFSHLQSDLLFFLLTF